MAEIEIVRTETIRPSSPTPDRLRKFGLSVFDQFQPDAYTSVVLFYPDGGEGAVSDRVRRLKLSLSETLVRFYPVAGRVVMDELCVDCDDGGVDFVEAKVRGCSVSDILGRPDDKVLGKLLPPCSGHGGAHPLLSVQANVFECGGGVAIGVRFAHVIMDACTMSTFLRGWGAVARGDTEAPVPVLDVVASLFPAFPATMPELPPYKVCECITRRFVFPGAKISSLRDKVMSAGTERPTRVAAVSTLIWKCLIKKSRHETLSSIVAQPVNLRRRLAPSLSENSLGNMVVPIFAGSDCQKELQGLSGQLRQGLEELTHNEVTQLKGSEEAMSMICERVKRYATLSAREDLDFYDFTSWCKLGWYNVDFGWGRPAWMSPVYSNMKNSVVMTDTRDGDGVEVLVTLPEHDMVLFETDPELLEFAFLNPSVCA